MANELDDLGGEIPDGDLSAGLEQKKLGGKKLVLFVVLPVLLFGVVGAVAFMMMGGESKDEHQEVAQEEIDDEPVKVMFVDLPEILVNLNTGGRKTNYLKIKVAIEVDRQSIALSLQEKMPRLIDNFQVYLRELRLEDLNGSAGMFRLKEELMQRVNTSIAPAHVKDVLFKEMLVQ